jgi:nickel/cobalt transporter (NiCoT) family protein
MESEIVSTSGLLLMLVLGLRHGLDPDHIACIDGLTWRAMQHGRRHGPWVGTLFAVGHGLLVTMVAIVVSEVGRAFDLPDAFAQLLQWAPTALLLLVAFLNLRQLLASSAQAAPASVKLRMIPPWLSNHAAPWAIVLTGALFAAVFDTATQASAWGYVAGKEGGRAFAALVAGLVFTIGMGVTDTIDGRLLWRIGRGAGRQRVAQNRRMLGWLVVGISCAVAVYNIGAALAPSFELNDLAFSASGFSLVVVIAVTPLLWGLNQHRLRRAASPVKIPPNAP